MTTQEDSIASRVAAPMVEWQITYNNVIHVFYDEEEAKTFVEGIKLPWDTDGGEIRLGVRKVNRYLPINVITTSHWIYKKDDTESTTIPTNAPSQAVEP